MIPYIIETIISIDSYSNYEKNGHFYNIAIGSDFDGFADAGIDLHYPSQLGDLVEAMKKYQERLFSDAEIRMIFRENAMRLSREGWTK